MLNQRAKNNRSFFYKFLNHNINLYFATKSLHQITLKLGEILEVTRQSISKWESDQAFPKIKNSSNYQNYIIVQQIIYLVMKIQIIKYPVQIIKLQKKPIYYKARRISSIIEVIIWILFFGLFISHVQLESLLIISATIIHLISLFKMKNNQITITINE